MSSKDLEKEEAALPPPQNGSTEADIIKQPPAEAGIAVQLPAMEAVEAQDAANDYGDDKLDELSRLELEMAELDKMTSLPVDSMKSVDTASAANVNQPAAILNESAPKDGHNVSQQQYISDEAKALLPSVDSETQQNGQMNARANAPTPPTYNELGSGTLNHQDLIAVLKGELMETETDVNQKPLQKKEIKSEIDSEVEIEGVTIEGEGQYQIMEVIDDIEEESETGGASVAKVTPNEGRTVTQAKLTPEEERAMAMEQIAGLNARAPRRRKQDIKPLKIENTELVSSLGADWSDDDEAGSAAAVNNERASTSKTTVGTGKIGKNVKKEPMPAVEASTKEVNAAASTSTAGRKRHRSANSGKMPNVIVLTSNQTSHEAAENNNLEKASTATEHSSIPTGFKRTRPVKRRIIWDPDAPETHVTYGSSPRTTQEPLPQPTSQNNNQPISTKTKRMKSVTAEKKAGRRAATPANVNAVAAAQKTSSNTASTVTAESEQHLEGPSTSKQALRSISKSPVTNGNAAGHTGPKKRKVSEIDRLMRDEGAANMLSSLESERHKQGSSPGEEDNNRPHKPLMRSRGGTAVEKTSKSDVNPPVVVATTITGKKRGPKPKPSTSWDYVYQKKEVSDDSMIIRRRSNSSYSSSASQHRLSVDGPSGSTSKAGNIDDAADEKPTMSTSASRTATPTTPKSKSVFVKGTSSKSGHTSNIGSKQASSSNAAGSKFIFAKPKDAQSSQKASARRAKGTSLASLVNDMKKVPHKRAAAASQSDDDDVGTQGNLKSTAGTGGGNLSALMSGNEKDVIIRKEGLVGVVVFSTKSAQISGTFTSQLMNDIVSALEGFSNDNECNVVAMITRGPHFCQGVDFSSLATGSLEQRKIAAHNLAKATKNFLKALATFPKPLIAGIQGTIVGLGVTQLPLFDIVLASEKTTLETPYAKIGQLPEGFCMWKDLASVRETTKATLFWLSEKLSAVKATNAGIITKLTTHEKLHDETVDLAHKMASMSIKTYKSMKSFIMHDRFDVTFVMLDGEFDKIEEQWSSNECFQNFKKHMEVGHF